MNTNINTVNTDANNEAAKTLTDMFAGATIEDYSINGGTITLTLVDGDTITIRHETKEIDITSAEFRYIREECKYVDEGITSRAAEAIKNGQAITAAWVEKTETYREPSDYDNEETTETISLCVMFDGDLRPTLLTDNTTRYSWKAEYPDFTIKRGGVSVTADSACISSSFRRP